MNWQWLQIVAGLQLLFCYLGYFMPLCAKYCDPHHGMALCAWWSIVNPAKVSPIMLCLRKLFSLAHAWCICQAFAWLHLWKSVNKCWYWHQCCKVAVYLAACMIYFGPWWLNDALLLLHTQRCRGDKDFVLTVGSCETLQAISFDKWRQPIVFDDPEGSIESWNYHNMTSGREPSCKGSGCVQTHVLQAV